MHRACQKQYVNKCRLLQNTGKSKSATTRSQQASFCFESQCLFCEGKVSAKSKPWSRVQTAKFRDSIMKTCNSRLSTCSDDSDAVNVKSKIASVFDLVAKGACYHQICLLSFFKGCNQPGL